MGKLFFHNSSAKIKAKNWLKSWLIFKIQKRTMMNTDLTMARKLNRNLIRTSKRNWAYQVRSLWLLCDRLPLSIFLKLLTPKFRSEVRTTTMPEVKVKLKTFIRTKIVNIKANSLRWCRESGNLITKAWRQRALAELWWQLREWWQPCKKREQERKFYFLKHRERKF